MQSGEREVFENSYWTINRSDDRIFGSIALALVSTAVADFLSNAGAVELIGSLEERGTRNREVISSSLTCAALLFFLFCKLSI